MHIIHVPPPQHIHTHTYLYPHTFQAQRAANASSPTRPGAGSKGKISGKAVLMNPKVS